MIHTLLGAANKGAKPVWSRHCRGFPTRLSGFSLPVLSCSQHKHSHCKHQTLSTATASNQVEHVDASTMSPSKFQETFLHRKELRRPCVIHGLSLGEIDFWTLASFRDAFAGAEMWDKDQLNHKKVQDYLADDDAQPLPSAGNSTTTVQESYLFEFLGPECGPPCSAHASQILESYEPPEQFFGPDLWKQGTLRLCVFKFLYSGSVHRARKFFD